MASVNTDHCTACGQPLPGVRALDHIAVPDACGTKAPIDIDKIVKACVGRRLDVGLLRSWLPEDVYGRLPYRDTPAEQYRSDITQLLANPNNLAIWLRQAWRLAGPFAEARVFSSALDALNEIKQ